MTHYLHKNHISGFIAAVCMVLDTVLPVIARDHLGWLRWRIPFILIGIIALIALLLQLLVLSAQEYKRQEQEKQHFDLLSKLVGDKEKNVSESVKPSAPMEALNVSRDSNNPRLMFTAKQEKGTQWRTKILFSISHLNGDAAEFIEVSPIQSARGGNIWIRFEPVTFLDSHHRTVDLDFWMDIAGIKIEHKSENLRWVFFRRDAELQNKKSVTYPVTVNFRRGTERMSELFRLTWNNETEKFTVEPWN